MLGTSWVNCWTWKFWICWIFRAMIASQIANFVWWMGETAVLTRHQLLIRSIGEELLLAKQEIFTISLLLFSMFMSAHEIRFFIHLELASMAAQFWFPAYMNLWSFSPAATFRSVTCWCRKCTRLLRVFWVWCREFSGVADLEIIEISTSGTVKTKDLKIFWLLKLGSFSSSDKRSSNSSDVSDREFLACFAFCSQVKDVSVRQKIQMTLTFSKRTVMELLLASATSTFPKR